MKYIKLFEDYVPSKEENENEFEEDYVPSKEEKENEFKYMMLARWQSDCNYFLGYGCGSERVLPCKNVEEHISRMKKLWEELPVKPEWLSYEEIETYEKDMIENRELKTNRFLN